MAEIKLAEAKELCTKAELELFLSSKGKELTAHDAAQLIKLRDRARQFRDKWRDLAVAQRRALQQTKGTRDVSKTERSARKAQLFEAALERLQQRIDQLPTAERVAAADGKSKSTSKTKRTLEHRASRAGVRKQLSEARDEKVIAARKSSKSSAPEASQTAPAPTTPAAQAAPQVASSPETANPPVASTPAAAATPKNTAREKSRLTKTKSTGVQQLSSAKQLQARTAAKEQRKQISGKTTRVRGHVSARGKRTQASRDQKSRG